ncbi:MAG TPA: hypothetical protein VFK27_04525, partial [Bacillales bacterium]|nr:hypothetical protein [Bacillales bacterium]
MNFVESMKGREFVDGIKVLQSFQFEVNEEPKSIYPFSPVYKVEKGNRSYRVKQTRSPIEKAIPVVNFT